MLKKYYLSSLFFLSFNVFSDTVILKDSSTFENVKTSLNKNKINIEFPNGEKKEFLLSEVLELRPKPIEAVTSDPLIEKAETSVPSKSEKIDKEEIKPATKKTATEAKPVDEKKKSFPNLNSDQVYPFFLPVWSPLNDTQYWYFGAGITIVKLFTLRN